MPTARFKDLCLDANDAPALADWWCTAMGYRRRWDGPDDGGSIPIQDPSGAGPLIWVNPVPEAKSLKNRMHLDVVGSTEALVALGATLVRPIGGDIEWDVLADPEGNEFCCFAQDTDPGSDTPGSDTPASDTPASDTPASETGAAEDQGQSSAPYES